MSIESIRKTTALQARGIAAFAGIEIEDKQVAKYVQYRLGLSDRWTKLFVVPPHPDDQVILYAALKRGKQRKSLIACFPNIFEKGGTPKMILNPIPVPDPDLIV